MNNGRDCAHGRQVGKCDACDLVEAERRILELEAQVEMLRESTQDAANVLGFLSFHLRGRIGEAALMDIAEKADALQGALDATPAQCLAEIKAQAVEDAVTNCFWASNYGEIPIYVLTDYYDELLKQVKEQK